jgi:hypothetical protein
MNADRVAVLRPNRLSMQQRRVCAPMPTISLNARCLSIVLEPDLGKTYGNIYECTWRERRHP